MNIQNMQDLTEQTIDTSYVYKGKIISVKYDNVLLPNGEKGFRETIEHNGGVCVVPLDDNGNVYMVRQFRYPYKEVVLEIPAGKREGDEEPLVCGIRELEEEVGAKAGKIVPLGELYPSPGYCGEIIWMYLATELKFTKQNLDDDEFLQVEKIPLKKAVDMILSGEIKDAKTQSAVLKAYILKSEK